ncbi:bifunctional diguanylate cyclase/phosphodiesterase, partial [Coprococcus sp. MSK.21.13]|nr:bifunctional diguanylate cyclase/phosphodiesterase [Coprococcus sp. MSK.21.13]
EVSNRLESFIPDDAILARLGGDEFIIARKGVFDLIGMQDFVKKMASLYEKPIIIEPYKFKVSFSVGIAMCTEDNLDRNTLIKNADVAMYYAKEDLNKMYVFYDKNLSRKVERKNKLELLLKNSVFDEEFEIHYQPQFNINTKEIIGVEALIRWNSPLEGIISPGEFIPIAETCGMIVDIGYWVMKNAIKQVSYWNKYNDTNLRVAINVSPKQINSLDFIKNLKTIIKNNEIDPKLIDIEITENIELTQEGVIKEVLEELACIGVKISIDDFGTGYSSLSYIKRFHIDRLKIAKELVDNISSDSVNLKVVKAIIMIAKTMNIKTIAEGVEDEFQLQKLIELGCDEIQGYIWDKPLKIKEFEKKYLSKTGRVIDFL